MSDFDTDSKKVNLRPNRRLKVEELVVMSSSNRGGARQGGGRKSSWLNKPTCTIRVPEAFAQLILEIAKELDRGNEETIVVDLKNKALVHQIKRSKLQLSDVPIYKQRGQPVVRLRDLLYSYQIAIDQSSE